MACHHHAAKAEARNRIGTGDAANPGGATLCAGSSSSSRRSKPSKEYVSVASPQGRQHLPPLFEFDEQVGREKGQPLPSKRPPMMSLPLPPPPEGSWERAARERQHSAPPVRPSQVEFSMDGRGKLRQEQQQQQQQQELQFPDEEWARRLQQEYDEEVAAKVKRASFTCPLCLEGDKAFDESVELDCLHRICSGCFHSLLEVHIREKRVGPEELCCPMPGCVCEITPLQVEGTVAGSALWDRFLTARAEQWKPGSRDKDILCECPDPGCGARFLRSSGVRMREVRCPECLNKFCPACKCRHKGLSCDDYQSWKHENDTAEAAFEELMQREGWKKCPCCQAPCERTQGCNFMTCYSRQCCGKKYFCYICGIEITKTQHFTHFPHGLFRPTCSGPEDDYILEEEEEEPPAPAEAGEAVPPQLPRAARQAGPLRWLGHVFEELRQAWVQPCPL